MNNTEKAALYMLVARSFTHHYTFELIWYFGWAAAAMSVVYMVLAVRDLIEGR